MPKWVPVEMHGGADNDTLLGTHISYEDGYWGGDGKLYGGPGDDTYDIYGEEKVIEKPGEGFDTVTVT